MPDTGMAPKPKQRFPLVSFGKIKPSPERNYLVKGLIPREGLVVIWGPPKCGKTFWTFDLAMHVALSRDYRGRQVTGGTVVYIACEGERGLAGRVEAFRRRQMAEDSTEPAFFLLTTRLDLVAEVNTLIGEMRAQLGEGGCAAVVLDTLNRSLVGSESSDEDMGAFVKAADAIREAFGAAVLIIHHCGIDDRRPRGHTSLAGAADAQIAVKMDTDKTISATVELMKDGEAGAEILSKLEVVELEPDQDGATVTSCVIMPASQEQGAAKRRAPKPTGAPKVALDMLSNAIIDHGRAPPAGSLIPGQKMVVPVDLWREYARKGSVSESDKPEAQRKAFSRAVTKLQTLGAVGIWNDLAWMVE